MKCIPENVDGPMGPWYRKVNELVKSAMESNDSRLVKEILGEPDFIEQVAADDRMPAGNKETDPRYPEVYWNYIDPFRPRKLYRFGISGEVIVAHSYETRAT